jgi:hypothetical protein
MAQPQTLNLAGNLPPEILQQQQALNRQQQMAQLLMQQGQQMPSGQMVSGRYVAPSFFQYAAPLLQTYAGMRLAEKGDKASADLAKALRQQYANEAQQYQTLLRGKEAVFEQAGPTQTGGNIPNQTYRAGADPQAAYLFGSTAYNPALQQVALKKLTEGPKWEKASIPNPDGSERQGWVNVNSDNPLSTFVEGGTKPAFSSLEGARFQYDTGMALPSSGTRPQANQPVSPYGGNVQFTPNQAVSTPTGQTLGTPIGQPTVGNQPTMTQASYTVGRGMSPRDVSEANKQVFVDKTKRQQEYAEKAPAAINFMQDTINNINGLIGDAKVVKDPKTGKERIEYGKVAPHEGFNTAVGVSGIGGGFGAAGFIPGTSTTDFKERFKQIGGQTFLQAYETIRGAGQITEQEGTKATAALNRMSLAQSELEFVKAAREFEEKVIKGMELARKRAGMPTQTQQGGWRVK